MEIQAPFWGGRSTQGGAPGRVHCCWQGAGGGDSSNHPGREGTWPFISGESPCSLAQRSALHGSCQDWVGRAMNFRSVLWGPGPLSSTPGPAQQPAAAPSVEVFTRLGGRNLSRWRQANSWARRCKVWGVSECRWPLRSVVCDRASLPTGLAVSCLSVGASREGTLHR